MVTGQIVLSFLLELACRCVCKASEEAPGSKDVLHSRCTTQQLYCTADVLHSRCAGKKIGDLAGHGLAASSGAGLRMGGSSLLATPQMLGAAARMCCN